MTRETHDLASDRVSRSCVGEAKIDIYVLNGAAASVAIEATTHRCLDSNPVWLRVTRSSSVPPDLTFVDRLYDNISSWSPWNVSDVNVGSRPVGMSVEENKLRLKHLSTAKQGL